MIEPVWESEWVRERERKERERGKEEEGEEEGEEAGESKKKSGFISTAELGGGGMGCSQSKVRITDTNRLKHRHKTGEYREKFTLFLPEEVH